MEATLLVLAGGDSRRMGRAKAWIEVGNTVLLRYVVERLGPAFSEVVVSFAEPEQMEQHLPYRVVFDRKRAAGPLAGLEAGLMAARNQVVFAVACDMPYVTQSTAQVAVAAAGSCDAAIPRQAPAKPAKPRKLLVTDIQMYSGHSTIPHGNYMIELMAKYTGAFDATFSNDPAMLKYPKIKEFDAVFFNNVCGMVHNDPEVRESLLRYIREGGGLGGNHAVTYANLNWPEFADMMGGWAGQHRVEEQVLKIEDPNSSLMKPFGSEPFTHTDEFYIFPPYSPYSREKQHVLMSIDVEKSDRGFGGRFSELSTRPDQDYGVAWVKGYGKGRTYFTPLGHTNIMYTDKRWTGHLLAAIQYILGDLPTDETPSAKARKTN